MIAKSTEAYAAIQTAHVLIRRAIQAADSCDRRYRKAKMLVPKPTGDIPPLDPNSVPPLDADWLMLYDEIIKMQMARSSGRLTSRRRKKAPLVFSGGVLAEPELQNSVSMQPSMDETAGVNLSSPSSSSSSAWDLAPPVPKRVLLPTGLPALQLSKAGRGAWMGGGATAGEVYIQ